MKLRLLIGLVFSLWTLACLALSRPVSPTAPAGPTDLLLPTLEPTATLSSTPTVDLESGPAFELIGHSALLDRGMNAGLAVYGKYAYVGSRTDGSHADAGVLVVDVSNPADPQVVYQIGPPEQGLAGQTSRELRIWLEQEVLIVLNMDCSAGLHDCGPSVTPPHLSFYDISGANAAAPRLMLTNNLPRVPHEMFLWDDPRVVGRALLYVSTPGGYLNNLLVLDISGVRAGLVQEIGNWGAPVELTHAGLHSLSLSVDGRRAYLAHLRDGFMVLDTSQLADGLANPQMQLITPAQGWAQTAVGPHSAVRLFGKPYVLTTEEVYGICPWSWAYLIDISDETRPQFVAQYKLAPHNSPEHCAANTYERYQYTSFSAHNPTLTKNLAFITWHSGGLQAVSLENPLQPAQVAVFIPEPLPAVRTEDPALSAGPDKVVMWSYPMIRDGLIYVVDVRNGLYILKYRGPFEAEVAGIRFLEGNSNLGDAQLWE